VKLAVVAALNVPVDQEPARSVRLDSPSAVPTAKLAFSADLQHARLANSCLVPLVSTVTLPVERAMVPLHPAASHVPTGSSSSTTNVSIRKLLLPVSVKDRPLSPTVSKVSVIIAQKVAPTANTRPLRSESASRMPNAPSVSPVPSCPTELASPAVLMAPLLHPTELVLVCKSHIHFRFRSNVFSSLFIQLWHLRRLG
jgi:hypothetical protein